LQKILAVSGNVEFYLKFIPVFTGSDISLRMVMSVNDALDMLAQKDEFSVILIDISDSTCIEQIKEIRLKYTIPLIAYASASKPEYITDAMQNGADEYFDSDESGESFFSSVQALCRRYSNYGNKKKKSHSIKTLGNMIVCLNTRRVLISGKNLNLTTKEFDMLALLIRNENRHFTYEAIYNDVWDGGYRDSLKNTIWSSMNRLNMKIKDITSVKYIINDHESGYKINPEILVKKNSKPISDIQNAEAILAIGYADDEFKTLEQVLSVCDIVCHRAESLSDALTMLRDGRYSLIAIKGDVSEGLIPVMYVREMTLAPVLVTSNYDDMKIKSEAIEKGADGYLHINGAFEFLCETVSAMIRRYNEYSNCEKEELSVISFGELTINKNSRRVFIGDHEIDLTLKEFDILSLITDYKGEVITYEQLTELVWKGNYNSDSYKPLMVLVGKLKDKLKINENSPEYIVNIRGMGYRLAS